MHLDPQTPSRDPKVTRKSLIDSLGKPGNEQAWSQFYDTYSTMIWEVAIRAGLSRTEAEEVVQETVISVFKKMPEFTYDPQKGSFKAWLYTLVHWRVTDQIRNRKPESPQRAENQKRSRSTGTATIDGIPGESLDAVWEDRWKATALEKALAAVKRQVKSRHYQIFDLVVVQHWPVRKVASSLGITAAQVYIVKHRLGTLLRREMRRLEQAGLT